jgi:ABC-type tungstate transport system substrate-binding protein
MNELSSAGPAAAATSGTKPPDRAAFAQIFALVLSVPAILFGLWMIWYIYFPGPCGDFGGYYGSALYVLFCWMVDLPIGVLSLAIGWRGKRGSPRLRQNCILAALVTLSLTVAAPLIMHLRHCT